MADGSIDDELVDAALRASRALVGVAARSLAVLDDDVTLVQYRALVVLASRGPMSAGALADLLGSHPSTVTRLCDRLGAGGLVSRRESTESRREVTIALTGRGRSVVDAVTAARRVELEAILGRLPHGERAATVAALTRLGDAADEPPDAAWLLGWADE
jgi:DNA-binding MarR family transcriptional regulator